MLAITETAEWWEQAGGSSEAGAAWWARPDFTSSFFKYYFNLTSFKVDNNGELTGDNMAYVYPDYR